MRSINDLYEPFISLIIIDHQDNKQLANGSFL